MNRHFILQFKISIEVVLSVFKLFPVPHDNQLEMQSLGNSALIGCFVTTYPKLPDYTYRVNTTTCICHMGTYVNNTWSAP